MPKTEKYYQPQYVSVDCLTRKKKKNREFYHKLFNKLQLRNPDEEEEIPDKTKNKFSKDDPTMYDRDLAQFLRDEMLKNPWHKWQGMINCRASWEWFVKKCEQQIENANQSKLTTQID